MLGHGARLPALLVRTPHVTRSPRVEQLLRVLEAEPGSTLRELAEATELPSRHLAMLLWRLEDDRLVVHEAHRWFLAP